MRTEGARVRTAAAADGTGVAGRLPSPLPPSPPSLPLPTSLAVLLLSTATA